MSLDRAFDNIAKKHKKVVDHEERNARLHILAENRKAKNRKQN